jgi:hypothetical protein
MAALRQKLTSRTGSPISASPQASDISNRSMRGVGVAVRFRHLR